MRPYPTRDGLPIPTAELELPESRLNLKNSKNFNNHHLYFSKRTYLQDPILNALRNLERSQELLPKDMHNQGKNTLHSLYSPPKRPTRHKAMEEIEEAYELGEKLKIRDNLGRYALVEISEQYWAELHDSYNGLKVA